MGRFKFLYPFLLFPLLLAAQNIETGGYLKLFAHPNLNAPYAWERLGSRVQLQLTQSLAERATFYAALNFNYDRANDDKNPMRVYPVETYLDFFFDKLDIRLGRQFIFWGKTDWINPTDNINPWDYENITAEIEDYRIPVTAVRADLYLSGWDLQLVLLPRFSPHRIPIEMPDSLAGLPVAHRATERPENRLTNGELGLRLSSAVLGVDFSFSYFYGFDKSPTIRIQMLPAQQKFIHTTEYSRQHVLGFDFATTFDKWVFKGEGAYFLTADRDGKDIFAVNPHLKYVLGLDYNLSDNWTLNGQFVQTVLFEYDRDYEEQTRIERHMPLDDVPEPYLQSLSGRIHYKWNDFLSLQLISVLNLEETDYFILPILSYAFADGINIYAGGTLFGGPAQSSFGRSKEYSKAFFEVKYSF